MNEKERLCSRFTNNYFYFGFFADEAGILSVKVEFPSEDAQKSIIKKNMTYKPRAFQKKLSAIEFPITNSEMEDFRNEIRILFE